MGGGDGVKVMMSRIRKRSVTKEPLFSCELCKTIDRGSASYQATTVWF